RQTAEAQRRGAGRPLARDRKCAGRRRRRTGRGLDREQRRLPHLLMKAFSYVKAQSADSAVELVREQGRFLAGGMDLLGEMKEGIAEPALLVSVKSLPGTRDIATARDKFSVGANVTLTTIAEHPEIRLVFPGLAQAAEEVGSPQM